MMLAHQIRRPEPTNVATRNVGDLTQMLETVFHNAERMVSPSYPPYNIIKTGDDEFRIEVAIAGFKKDELDIVVEKNILTVTGQKAELEEGAEAPVFIHKGIAARKFERVFHLNDYIEVGVVDLQDGILTIALLRQIPEKLKPKRIEIS